MLTTRATLIASIAIAVRVSAGAPRAVGYRKDVRPILQSSCGMCHEASGFSVESDSALMQGTKYGPMIDPGHADESNLVWLLAHDSRRRLNMPKRCAQMNLPQGKCARAAPLARELPKHEGAWIARRIDQGALDN